MTSSVSDYLCDIFISYHKGDNNLDRWVSEFADSLKNEIKDSFGKDISIQTSGASHSGLQENGTTSLANTEKVKCLIFIPIISHNYCDRSNSAWINELLPFLDFAKSDEIGLELKVSGGNFLKRILPIKIDEINPLESQLFEKVMADEMNSIDFLYNETGVNQPLQVNDNPEYQSQLNKVALLTKELLGSMSDYIGQEAEVEASPNPANSVPATPPADPDVAIKKLKSELIGSVVILFVLILFAVLYFAGVFDKN